MSPTVTADRPAKLARLRSILDAHGAPALHLSTAESLSWLFDGARVAVPYAGAPVCSAIVGRDGSVTVTALANEIDRLGAEELAGAELVAVPWHEPLPEPAAGVLRDSDVVAELRAARAALLPVERRRYSALGREVASAVTVLLRQVRPTTAESEVAAELVRAVVALGAEPVVVLVAGEARGAVQHPLPTGAPLGRRAMAVIGAKRHGLIVNLTRWIRFGGGDDTEAEIALREVEADAYAATRPGRELGDVLTDIASSYERHGFGPDAWQRHHQGGPTGYLGRDPKVTPGTRDVVVAGQAFAWNPWVPGAKLEDTVLVEADRLEVLTSDPDWPTAGVRGIARPLPLDLA